MVSGKYHLSGGLQADQLWEKRYGKGSQAEENPEGKCAWLVGGTDGRPVNLECGP